MLEEAVSRQTDRVWAKDLRFSSVFSDPWEFWELDFRSHSAFDKLFGSVRFSSARGDFIFHWPHGVGRTGVETWALAKGCTFHALSFDIGAVMCT